MRVILALAASLALGCSDEGSSVAGPGGSGGASGGSGGAQGGSGGVSGGSGGATGGADGGPSCDASAPPAGSHGAPLVDQPISPFTGVKHDIAVEHSGALGGFVVAHVKRVGTDGLGLEITTGRPEAGALAVGPASLAMDDSAPANVNTGWPAIATTSDGERVLVVWADDRLGAGNGPQNILGQFYAASPSGLAKSGANFVISTQPATNDWRPEVVFAPGANRFWVAWTDDRAFASKDGARSVYARSVGLDAELGPELPLSDETPWQDGTRAASSGDRVLFVWGEVPGTVQPYVARYRGRIVDAATGAPAAPFTLLERPGLVLAGAGVAWDPLRCRYLVAWQESDNQQIHGALLDASGGVVRPAFAITDDPAGAGLPHLAYAKSTATFVLTYGNWQTADAFLVELDGNGDPLSAPRSLHAVVPTKGTFFQDVAAGGSHALAISNEDYARIEGALFAAVGG